MDTFNTKVFSPNPALGQVVKHYRWVSFPIQDQSFWVPSDSRNLMLYIFQGRAIIQDNQSTFEQPKFSIRGTWDGSFKISFKGEILEVLGVEFTDIGLHHVTGIGGKYFVNKFDAAENHITPDNSFYKSMDKLQGCPQEQVKQIEKLLLGCIKRNKQKPIPEFRKALEFAKSKSGNCTVKELADISCLHEKTMNRYFAKYTGLSCKRYLSLLKFEYGCKELLTHPDKNFSALNISTDYFDQSHFIHFFKSIGGLQPGELDQVDATWIRFLTSLKD